MHAHPALCLGLALILCAATGAAPARDVAYRLPGGAAAYGDPYIAAGFRALFTCSAHFLMRRELPDILKVELADTAALALPEPAIDVERRLVRADDGRGRTAVAAFRDTMGCTLLPPNWSTGDVARLPYVSRALPAHDARADFPTGDRAQTNPGRAGRALLDRAFDGEAYGSGTLTAGVIVIRGGRIVAERYAPGFGVHQGYRTWSTAKSITASLIAIAARKGLLSLDAPLEAEPGTRWKYANNDTLLLLRALRHALDDDLTYLRFPYDELLHRIGMFDTWMETDHAGNFIGSSQVYTTARDIARLGLLYLNDGVWNGERILPEGWTAFVATPAPSSPRETDRQGYGAQFWLFDTITGIPPGTYTTAGNKGQYSTIVPAHDMVVVRTGVDPLGVAWNQPKFVIDAVAAFAD